MEDRTEGASERLEVLASCPHCGGANSWRLLQTLLHCAYCGSSLWWPRPADRPGLLIAEDAIGGPDDLLDVLATLDAMRERARLAGLAPAAGRDDLGLLLDGQDNPMLPALHEIKAERRHLFSLHEHRTVLAPYLLTASTFVFHALGRSRDVERKEHRSLFFTSEEIRPAYPAPWDFRDRGLWVARQRFRALEEPALALRPIRMREAGAEPEDFLKPWRRRRELLAPDMTPVQFDAEIFESRRWWVWRPFHLVRATSPLDEEWLLVDGQFATVAGRPAPDEVRRILSGSWDPLLASEIRDAAPLVIPFRCPECGEDVPLDDSGDWQMCGGCGRVLEPGRLGLKAVPHRTIERRQIPWWPETAAVATAWLPFWRFRGKFRIGARVFDDLAEFAKAVIPATGGRSAKFPSECPFWYVPAFDALTADGHDAWAFATAAELTALLVEPRESRLRVDERVETRDAVLAPAHSPGSFARTMPRLALSILPVGFHLRLSPMALRPLEGALFETASADLVFAPAPILGEDASRIGGPRGSVAWVPLRDRSWPPDARRSVRRWLQKARGEEAARNSSPRAPRRGGD